jgi:hypothetical protein
MESEDILKIKTFLLRIRTDHYFQSKNILHNKYEIRYEFFINNKGYVLGLKGFKNLNEIIKILVSYPSINTNFSLTKIQKELEKVIALLVNKEPKGIDNFCKETVENFVNGLETINFSEFEIIIPSNNLKLEIPKFQIGKVIFAPSNYIDFEELKKIEPKNTPEEVKRYINRDLLPRFENKILAIVKVNAKDIDHARDIGMEEIERSLNILRFYSRGTQKNDSLSYRMFIGIEGLVFQGQIPILHINKSLMEIDPNYRLHFENTGYLYKYIIDDEILENMKSLSLDIVNEILSKRIEDMTDFEKALLNSLNYYGKGMYLIDNGVSFLNFIISLELILTNTWEPQKGLLAERVALLIGETSDHRIEIFDEIERLYDLRSNLIHNGINEIKYSDITILSYILFQTLIKLIPLTKTIRSISELKNKFNKLKFNTSLWDETV